MLKLRRFACEGLETGCVTDEARPRFSFAFESDRQGAGLREVTLEANGWTWRGTGRASVRYDGAPLSPYTCLPGTRLRDR
jgi:alpha-L-rhamnosidase